METGYFGENEVTAQSIGKTTGYLESQHEKGVAVVVSPFEFHDDTMNQDQNSREQVVLKTTKEDARNMQRMGKSQQLVRQFRLLSVASFVALATAAWELGIFLITPGLINGGPPALLYSTLWGAVGFGPIYFSMAEMASMAPIAGAQYHWVSEFAPEKHQKILSYLTGWTSTLAWQSGNALGAFLVGTMTQVIISIALPEYQYPAWHATLLCFGASLIAFSGCVWGSRVLPHWQNTVFAIHILSYFALLVPIWVKAEKATHAQVWTEFVNAGGWPNMTLAVLVGQLSGLSNLTGIDTCAHMAEEVKNASVSVPKAMISIYIVNSILIFPAIVTLCYHIPDMGAALGDPSTYPAVYVLRQVLSPGWLMAFLMVIVLLLIASNIAYLAAVTRDLFAFSRDKGFPFSSWISKVDEKRHVPVNSVIITTIIAMALALTYLGSPVAFYAINSLLTVALLQCYSLSIGCCLWRKIYYPETLPPAKFSLGKWGIPVNIAAVIFSVWAFFWSFWPTKYQVTASGFNWSSVVFAGTLIVAMIYYFTTARHHYTGPVIHVEGRKVRTR